MTTKELVHDSNVCFKGLLVKPSTIYIRETQISRLLALLGYQPQSFLWVVTHIMFRFLPVIQEGCHPCLR